MYADAQYHVQNYDQCLWFKAKPARDKLHLIIATHQLQLVYVNYIMIKNYWGDKDISILNNMDNFTWYAQAIGYKFTEGKNVSQGFVEPVYSSL